MKANFVINTKLANAKPGTSIKKETMVSDIKALYEECRTVGIPNLKKIYEVASVSDSKAELIKDYSELVGIYTKFMKETNEEPAQAEPNMVECPETGEQYDANAVLAYTVGALYDELAEADLEEFRAEAAKFGCEICKMESGAVGVKGTRAQVMEYFVAAGEEEEELEAMLCPEPEFVQEAAPKARKLGKKATKKETKPAAETSTEAAKPEPNKARVTDAQERLIRYGKELVEREAACPEGETEGQNKKRIASLKRKIERATKTAEKYGDIKVLSNGIEK